MEAINDLKLLLCATSALGVSAVRGRATFFNRRDAANTEMGQRVSKKVHVRSNKRETPRQRVASEGILVLVGSYEREVPRDKARGIFRL